MIQNTLAKIEAAIRKIGAADADRRAELMRLLSALKSEVEGLDRTHSQHAESIAGFTEAAAREALRKDPSPKLAKLSLEALAASVQGFEASHPALVRTVGEICRELSSIGI